MAVEALQAPAFADTYVDVLSFTINGKPGGFVHWIGDVTTEEMYYADDGQPISNGRLELQAALLEDDPGRVQRRAARLREAGSGHRSPARPRHPALAADRAPARARHSVFFAIKHTVHAAREDAGLGGWFELSSPATVEQIQLACAAAPRPEA